jgi:hypothetical protein
MSVGGVRVSFGRVLMRIKYTRELLEEAVKQSISVAGVLRLLGLRQAGGTQAHIGRRIREFGIDTSHFLGKRANCGDRHRGTKRRAAAELLVNSQGLSDVASTRASDRAYRLRKRRGAQ